MWVSAVGVCSLLRAQLSQGDQRDCSRGAITSSDGECGVRRKSKMSYHNHKGTAWMSECLLVPVRAIVVVVVVAIVVLLHCVVLLWCQGTCSTWWNTERLFSCCWSILTRLDSRGIHWQRSCTVSVLCNGISVLAYSMQHSPYLGRCCSACCCVMYSDSILMAVPQLKFIELLFFVQQRIAQRHERIAMCSAAMHGICVNSPLRCQESHRRKMCLYRYPWVNPSNTPQSFFDFGTT